MTFSRLSLDRLIGHRSWNRYTAFVLVQVRIRQRETCSTCRFNCATEFVRLGTVSQDIHACT